jgi:hypothetical protein
LPSDDLILNLRQIAQYAPTAAAIATDALLLQRGGLGGPYQSISPPALVSTALIGSSAPLQVADQAPADAVGGQVFTNQIATPIDGAWLWNNYLGAGSPGPKYVAAGPAGLMQVDITAGWRWFWAAPGSAGAICQFGAPMFAISPTGYVTLGDQVLLARDPAAPLEAATAQYAGALVTGLRSYVDQQLSYVDQQLAFINQTFAPLMSPAFSGVPTAPTAAPGSATGQLATTAFVMNAISSGDGGGVASFNGRAGAVTLTAADLSGVGGALLASPSFTGFPLAPTATPGTNTTQLATTAFVMAAVAGGTAGVASFNTRTGVVSLIAADVTAVLPASTTNPAMNGAVSVGTLNAWSRGDHVHPTDTSRAAATALAGYLPLAGGTLSGPLTPLSTAGIVGTATNDNPAAGSVGEVISSVVTTGVPLTSATPQNVAGLTVTPGDWNVFAEIWLTFSVAGATQAIGWINTVSAAIPAGPAMNAARSQLSGTLATTVIIALTSCRESVATSTNVYFGTQAIFASGTCSATGKIWARRVR